MTLTEILNAQSIAGARYQAAVNEFYSAYIELAALDGVLANRGVSANCADVRTFGQLSADLRPFHHPVYAPLKLPSDWREVIAQRRDELIAAFITHAEKEQAHV